MPEVVVSERVSDEPAPRGENRLEQVMLERHNAARRAVGAPPLQWDDALAGDALDYARYLARNRKFEHADQSGWTVRQGENLWMGTRTAFTYDEMVGGWIDEQRFFRRGIFPQDSSSTGRWQDVAHYTQLIWPTSTRIGCAIAANDKDEFLVCRYFPAGNIAGRDPLKG
ncbi:MAG: CAP domain-containing protein [Blastomonas sp.]